MRDSQNRNPARTATPNAIQAYVTGSLQPASWMPYTRAIRPTIDRTRPRGSSRPGVRVARLRDVGQDPADPDDDDRDVDQEHRAPPEVLEQEPAEQRPEGDRATDCRCPDADRLAALRGREDHGDDRQRHGQHRRAADAHQPTRDDQLHRGLGEGAEQGRRGEQQEADDQDLAPAVAVAEDAPGEQQGGEHQGVGVDRPDQLALGGAEVLLDRLERDVEHGVVEHDDEQADDQGGQRAPPVRRHDGGGAAGRGGRARGAHGGSTYSGADIPSRRVRQRHTGPAGAPGRLGRARPRCGSRSGHRPVAWLGYQASGGCPWAAAVQEGPHVVR